MEYFHIHISVQFTFICIFVFVSQTFEFSTLYLEPLIFILPLY